MADFGLGIETELLRGTAREFVFPALAVHEKKMGLWEQLPMLSNLGVGNAAAVVFLVVSRRAWRFARWYRALLDRAVAANSGESRGIFGPVVHSGLGLLDKPGHNRAQMEAEGAFAPFLVGPRNCAGSHVAIMMASVAFAYILANYDFRLAPGPRPAGARRPGTGAAPPREPGADLELRFESHYSIAGWESGPWIQFRARRRGGTSGGETAGQTGQRS